MKTSKILYTIALAVVLLASGPAAFAASTFKVTSPQNNNTFRITRTGNTAVQETIDWRVVSLSAIEGIHYNGIQGGQAGVYSGTVTFAANETYKEITINELTPSDAYMYQNGGTRKYRFEVLDKDGSILASKDRTMTTGTSVPSSGLFNVKTGTIQSDEFWIDDSGYKQTNSPHTINRSSFYTDAEKNYIVTLGVPLHMTLELQAKEEDDAYEYLQVLIDNTTGCDSENDADKGNPGTPSLSRYMACFEMAPSDTYTTYKTYTFPVANVADGTKATDPWGYGTDFPLSMQKFKNGCRSTDYKIIVPNSFNTITVRFDASGSKGSDKWWIRNLKAKLTAIDNVAPVVINNYKVSGGRHQKGNTIYVSVPFKEIVTVTGTPTLSSNWGTLSYIAGSGSNVLSFKGTIDPTDNNAFSVSSYSLNGGTIKDLAGNSFSGSISHSFGTTLDSDYAWSTSNFNSLNDGSYEIYTTQDLRHLALMVNSGNNNCSGLTFRQTHDITYTHTTEWDDATSTENNYIAIGTYNYTFNGTFDGQNHTISGIRLYKGGNTNADDSQGLFGDIGSGGIVRGVNLADARITGHDYVGGIAGNLFSATVEDCTVAANVCIHAVQGSSYFHGGIVGYNQGTMQRCLSRARLTVANSTTGHSNYGAIVGSNNTDHAVKDCIVIGATVPDVTYRGAIIGQANEITNVQRNYYRACTVAGKENATGVGVGYDENTTTSPHDVTTNQGARALYSLTLPEHASVVRTASATLPGTGNATYTTGADIAGVPYAFEGASLTLSYSNLPDGGSVIYKVNGTAIDGNSFTMPAGDVTVTAQLLNTVSYIDADGSEQSHACIPIVSGTTTYGDSNNAEGWYSVSGDVTIDGTRGVKFLDRHVNIILCDGATLTSNATTEDFNGIDANNGSLTIYAQSGGTGRIVATAKDMSAINAKLDMDINGGIISATTKGTIGSSTNDGYVTIRRGSVTAQGTTRGISANTNLTILGGTVSVTATRTDAGSGLSTFHGDVSIFGGNVTAKGYNGIEAGIRNPTSITLGCVTPADRIIVSSYACSTLTIADGQTLTDGTATYTGTLSADQIASLAGKTLQPLIPDPASLTQGTKDGVSAYWGTYYNGTTNHTLVGATAYTLGSDCKLYRLGDDGRTIPKGVAVVIIATSADAALVPAGTGDLSITDHAPGGNILVGNDIDTSYPGIYVLSVSSGEIGFRKLSTGTLPAHKAGYLPQASMQNYDKQANQEW